MPSDHQIVKQVDIPELQLGINIAQIIGIPFPLVGPPPSVDLESLLDQIIRKKQVLQELEPMVRTFVETKKYTEEFSAFLGRISEAFTQQGISSGLVEYPHETTTCNQKYELWNEIGFRKRIKRDADAKVDIMKTVVFRYQKNGDYHYIVASTAGNKRVHTHELRVEFGLSREEAKTLTHLGIDEVTLFLVTGTEKGSVSPLLPETRLRRVDGVYFTRDLMDDAILHPEKLYDIPLGLTNSLLVNAAGLYGILRNISQNYRRSLAYEKEVPLEILKWEVQKLDTVKSGVQYNFTNTIVRFQGRDYLLKSPRKSAHCMALPLPIEQSGEKTDRVILPLSYDQLVAKYEARKRSPVR